MIVHLVHGEAEQDGLRVGMTLAVAGWEHMGDAFKDVARHHNRRLLEAAMRAEGVTGLIRFREEDAEFPEDPQDDAGPDGVQWAGDSVREGPR